MKVAYLVTRSDTIGGSHIHIRDVALAMKERGHRAVILMGGNGLSIEKFRGLGLEIIEIPSLVRQISPLYDLRAYFQIKRTLSSIQPDLVSAHSSKAGLLGRLAAKSLNLPVLFTAHGWSFTEGKKSLKANLYRILEQWAAPYSDKIITVSDYDRGLALKNFTLPDDRITMIHNGMKGVSNEYISKHDSSRQVHIIKIARFDPPKDHMELLEAVRGMPNIHLHFVGDGSLMENVIRRVRNSGMREQVTFWGSLDRVEHVLAQGHIFVLISNWEGFPRSTLEAMRAGLPTIVSDVGGASEAVIDGETGFVVEKGNIEQLRDRIARLVEDPGLRKFMGAAAKRRFEQLYTFDIMFQKTYSIYKELIHHD